MTAARVVCHEHYLARSLLVVSDNVLQQRASVLRKNWDRIEPSLRELYLNNVLTEARTNRKHLKVSYQFEYKMPDDPAVRETLEAFFSRTRQQLALLTDVEFLAVGAELSETVRTRYDSIKEVLFHIWKLEAKEKRPHLGAA